MTRLKTPLALLSLLGLTLALGGCKRCGRQDARATGAIPTLSAARFAEGAITIDGRLDEKAWQHTGSTGPLVSSPDGRLRPESPVNGSARVGWDARRLYFAFVVEDRAPTSPFKPEEEDPHVWERASAVELMIQPGDPGNNRHYYEVQVDVAGAVWDTRFDDYNAPIVGSGNNRRFGHQHWRSGVEKGIVVERGRRYTVELAIPFAALKSPQARVPPHVGDSWRVNLYTFRDGQRETLAWSPILGQGNFHKAARFGRVRFAGPAGD